MSAKDIAVGSVLVVPTTTIGGVWFKLQNATFISMRGSLESINEALAFISYRPKNTFSGTSLLVSIQSEESVHRVYGSTVVDISIPPLSFKLVSLSLSCSPLF